MIEFAAYIVASAVVLLFVLFMLKMAGDGFGLVVHAVVYCLTLGHVNLKKMLDDQRDLEVAKKTLHEQQLVDQLR